MNVSVGAKTDTGRRTNNEDKLIVVDVRRHNLRADGVLIIADGMGGRNFGEKAAGAAVETVCDTLVEMLHAEHSPSVDVEDALDSALRKANARVYELAGSDSQNQGMGTTCVAAVVENNHVYIAHAGDSRAYRWRNGELARLTDDHSYVAEQVRAGVITEENAKHSRFRNVITRAVGIEPTITPDVAAFDLEAGDALLLCTDGLTNMVPEEEIGLIISQAASSQAAADKLVTLANQNGGKDNITAIVARLEVGNKTQRMRTNDLAQAAPEASAAPEPAAVAPVAETAKAPEDLRNSNGKKETAPAPVKNRPPEYVEDRKPAAARPRGGSGAGAWALSLLCLLLLGSTLYLGDVLTQAGYKFQASQPFIYKPAPPPPPKPPDLSRVAYGVPSLLSVVPVRGDLLTHDAADDGLTVVTLSGQVLRLAPDGRTLFKYALPKRYSSTPSAPSAGDLSAAPVSPPVAVTPPASAPGVFFANDTQGDLYVSDTASRTVTKFHPNGDYIGVVASGKPKAPHALALKGPQALAVGKDGSVFVVDAQRLLVIPAKPAATP